MRYVRVTLQIGDNPKQASEQKYNAMWQVSIAHPTLETCEVCCQSCPTPYRPLKKPKNTQSKSLPCHSQMMIIWREHTNWRRQQTEGGEGMGRRWVCWNSSLVTTTKLLNEPLVRRQLAPVPEHRLARLLGQRHHQMTYQLPLTFEGEIAREWRGRIRLVLTL